MTASLLFRSLCLAALLPGFFALGCARAKVSSLPDGVNRISCERGMRTCVTRAEKLCDDKGYIVVGGESRTRLLGGKSSNYQQLNEVAELEIICGQKRPEDQTAPLFSLPARRDAEAAATTSTESAATACVPGTTQKCVGAGACDGGQVCLSDGSGFGSCDCGEAKPVLTAPAAPVAPVEPAPTQPTQPTQPAPAAPTEPVTPHKAPEPTPLTGQSAQ